MTEDCIFIVGYMGVGKSSGGRRLARSLGMPFADTDITLMEQTGKDVTSLFEEWGEARFREEESNVLRGLVKDGVAKVIATGGGTPCHADNMDFMLAQGTVLHFQVSLESLVRRLGAKRKQRPLIAHVPIDELGEFVQRHLAERMPVYSRAHITVDADSLDGARLALVGRMLQQPRKGGLNP